MNGNLTLVLSLLFFAGILAPAYAQTTENVVINEVDINPPGDDSSTISEWVELYNPTDGDIDIGGWSIASTTVLKKIMTIQPGTIIESGKFLTYSHQSIWFTDTNESVELLDENDIVIDKTPNMTDIKNDFTSWQRLYDGYDTDNSDDWKFVTSTPGSSNGKIIVAQDSDETIVTVSSEEPFYLFGEVATIKGSVSKKILTVQPYFSPAQILVSISGPNFDTVVPLYPDLNLNYSTTLSLHKVRGINEGLYNVTVNYGDATANTSFSVGFETFEEDETQDAELGIATDRSQYIPGQLVSITGFATDIIPLEGMRFTITDSDGKLVTNGNLFPTDGEFATSIFINNVDPSYGTYDIVAKYSDLTISTSFDVVKDVRENVPISLWTDKTAYGVGDLVQITGRLNQVWIGTLDLEILQTKQAVGSSIGGSNAGFKILDGLQIQGDGFFTFNFTIPDHLNRLGDYRISVSKDIGAASTIIHAVANPDEFVVSDTPLTILSDKEIYDVGDTMTLSGFIKDPLANSSYQTASLVKISIFHKDGTSLEMAALSSQSNNGRSVDYDFTAIPETSGSYSVKVALSQSVFSKGEYVVKSKYLDHTVTKTFTVVNSLDLTRGPIISLEKKVYGLGETVHLTGMVPPTAIQGVDITVTKPDGTVTNSGTTLDTQRFSWSWITPISESFQFSNAQSAERSVSKSNFGVYKISVSVGSLEKDLFFKVSKDPENDSLSTTPLFVSTEKSLYKVGDKLKVIGNVIQREQGDEGLQVPERVVLRVLDGTFPFKQIHESAVYPTQGGDFSGLFELPTTIFSEGPYTVKASYAGVFDAASFSVANDSVFDNDGNVTLLISTDKSEYYPGDIVVIAGKPNKLFYLEKFDVSVAQKSDVGVAQKADVEIACDSLVCGDDAGPVTTIRPSSSGSFSHQFTIPDSPSAIGTYEATVDAGFEKKSITFIVLDKPQTPKLDTIIEKTNRIPEKTISITTKEKTIDDVAIGPRVLSGSLITLVKGDESVVNLRVSTVTGTCIIGPDADCLVRESTRKPGQIYDIVDVDGASLYVRYSGPDVRLEKFSILPESSTAFLADTNWNVEVIKDEQVSRFYYKVTYKSLEQVPNTLNTILG